MNAQDRSDEIRTAVIAARRAGWAAQLDHACRLMGEQNEPELARAVVASVASELRA